MIKLTDILEQISQFDHNKYRYYVRWSAHIHDDLDRNWSAWSGDQGGFKGTEQQLKDEIERQFKEYGSFSISWDTIYDKDKDRLQVVKNLDVNKTSILDKVISELYKNYWVLVDTRVKGISGHELPNNILNIKDAIELIENSPAYQGGGFGDTIDGRRSEVIFSSEEYGEYGYHILQETK